ncbi:hypothetical protein BOO86_21785 [Mycobacterium sp. CBMA 234]|uniref:alpha/beta fold hydrolase n=1 Tax=Mycolicibacterium sp. CBMA 234 TaxID=1918495 RepID=UPI0012DD5AF8|nr:alpha/beta hydrolase [Mycolicibacterium sp. CBMA 234]MUL67120.1 hypothetical protein [Mycolicibacterium sp. CBMA 234]
MTEQIAPCNGIQIAYETFGDRADPAMVLIMGMGSQMVTWPTEVCDILAARGYFVIRFDNRDTGHSSRITGGPKPNPLAALLFGSGRSASYTIEDMSQDVLGLLDHLGIDKAHMFGGSMGGVIGQSLAINHPDRVLSLASAMAPTGASIWTEMPKLSLLLKIIRLVGNQTGNALGDAREKYVDQATAIWRAQGSPGEPFDEAWTRAMHAESWDRGVDLEGSARQTVAIASSANRRPLLRKIKAPTLILHGSGDKLIPPKAGRYAANAIPGARLLEIATWGHDLPPTLWKYIATAVADNADRARVSDPT